MKSVCKKFIAGCGFWFISLAAYAMPPAFDSTSGIWKITGKDILENVWDGSTLKFESQVADGDNFLLTGFFTWTGNDGVYFGRENFIGVLFADNSLHIDGTEIIQPSSGIVVATYDAVLASTGNDFINGRWDGSSLVPSNSWTAHRDSAPVPEPSIACLLLGSAVFGLVVRRCRSRSHTTGGA